MLYPKRLLMWVFQASQGAKMWAMTFHSALEHGFVVKQSGTHLRCDT